MKAEKIDHVSFMIKDLDKAKKFFGELFETDFLEPWPIESIDILESVDPLGIDLVTPLTPDGLTQTVLARRGEGVSMVSFKVPNLKEGMAEMESRGVRLLWHGKLADAEYAIYDPRDTFGVMIEIIEYKSYPMGANHL